MFVRQTKSLLMKQSLYAFVLFLLTSVVFTSCSKEKSAGQDGSTYYIKGKKDGVAFTYSANAMAKITDFSSSGAGISLAFMANAQPNAASLEGLAVSINFSDGITPAVGTYTEDYSGFDYVTAGVYNPNSMTIVWASGLHYPTVKPLKINILTKTATEMTGTFEGAFYKQDVSIPEIYDDQILFTECEFKLPVK
jgi:hypothetical protein